MKNSENKKAKQIQAIAVCGCLCLLTVGAGVTYRAFEKGPVEPAEQTQPVTAVKSPTMEIAALERDKQSNDPGKAPEAETKPSVKQKEKPVFAYPLQGDVVLPYSIDHAIYDPTLEQYRTNASVSISAEPGAEVKAAADGTVQQVTADAENGNTIIISHENGWLTTYGQLEEAVNVVEGDMVVQGQAIGFVDEPTKYGVALGSHLEFAMEQNGEPKNPVEYLK